MSSLRASKFGSLLLAFCLIALIAQGSYGFFAVDSANALDPTVSSSDDKKDPTADPLCFGVPGGLVLRAPGAICELSWWDASRDIVRQANALWPDPTGPPTSQTI